MGIEIESCYRRYGPMVLRRCRRLLSDPEKAEDAMQDVFVQLLLHQDRLTDAALSSLLFRMATHVCLNRLRSDSRRPESPEAELLGRIARAADADQAAAARQLLGRLFGEEPELPSRVSSRVIATLHLLDGMTLQQVARETGLSVSGVRKRLRRIKKRVRELEEVTV